jgi:amidase
MGRPEGDYFMVYPLPLLEHRSVANTSKYSPLHGVTILLKNQIATYNLNNTSGSTALLGAKTGRDAAVVKRLREGGAVILGKPNMTQWGNSRDPEQGNGWSADVGQALGV